MQRGGEREGADDKKRCDEGKGVRVMATVSDMSGSGGNNE